MSAAAPQRSPIHFIAGLPRSGSTLLSAILRQNPRFRTSVTSPVAGLVTTLLPRIGSATEFAPFFDDTIRQRLLAGLFELYHGLGAPDSVIFDTNRSWTSRLPLLRTLFPQARVICTVRDLGWVIDSVERALRRNPLQASRALGLQSGASVYARVNTLMGFDTGLIGSAWAALREAWFSDEAGSMIVIDYDDLVAAPAEIIARLYAALGETPFTHDFDDIAFDTPGYDEALGMPGLHDVRPRVTPSGRRPCLPPDLFAKHQELNFWKGAAIGPDGPTLLAR